MSQFEFHTMLWIGGIVWGAPLRRAESKLDYLMFLFYKPGFNLLCKETRNPIGADNFKTAKTAQTFPLQGKPTFTVT